MKVSEALIAAKALIDTPDKWTQGALARDKTGAYVGYSQLEAVCFCSMGAVFRVAVQNELVAVSLERALEMELTGHCAVSTFNDARLHWQVMELFDKAIATQQSKGN